MATLRYKFKTFNDKTEELWREVWKPKILAIDKAFHDRVKKFVTRWVPLKTSEDTERLTKLLKYNLYSVLIWCSFEVWLTLWH